MSNLCQQGKTGVKGDDDDDDDNDYTEDKAKGLVSKSNTRQQIDFWYGNFCFKINR